MHARAVTLEAEEYTIKKLPPRCRTTKVWDPKYSQERQTRVPCYAPGDWEGFEERVEG